MTKFGTNQLTKTTPEWVLPALVAITFICQGLPDILQGYDIISPKNVSITELSCKIVNLLCAAVSMFFGKTSKQ